jgi:TRAP-type mannitol/chloroaromatic compound transport system permease large subunit
LSLSSRCWARFSAGIATPTEAASVGAVGAILLAAIKGTLGAALGPVVQRTRRSPA